MLKFLFFYSAIDFIRGLNIDIEIYRNFALYGLLVLCTVLIT
jgi:hypothetical protein